MKCICILQLITCCTSPVGPAMPTNPRQRVEETRALMTGQSSVVARDERALPYRRRGTKLSGIGSKSMPAQWKPSLCAISEDRAVVSVVVAGRSEQTVRPGTPKRVAGKSVSKAKIRLVNYKDNEFRRSSSLNAMPAFTPALFLF